jgi:hypothetical protein
MKRKDNLSKRALGAALAADLAAPLGKKLDLASGNSSPELFSPLNRLSDYKILFVSLLWVEGWKAWQMLAKAPRTLPAFSLARPPAARTEKATNTFWCAREGRFSHLLYVVAAGEKMANCTQVIWTRHGGYQNAARHQICHRAYARNKK